MKCIYCGHYIQHECRINSLSYSKNLSKVNKQHIINTIIGELEKIDIPNEIMKIKMHSNYENMIKNISTKLIKEINSISNKTDINDIITFLLEHAIVGFVSVLVLKDSLLRD